MKQKQNPSNLEKTYLRPHKISFKQAIQKIELSALKQTLQKKKITFIKNRLKQEWLDRIKIISPRISPTDRQSLFRATDSFADSGSFKHSKHLCYRKDPQFNDIDELFQNRPLQLAVSADEISKKQEGARKSCEGSSTGLQRHKMENLRQRKFKENWKHSYRKDEMNVLRYSASSTAESKFYKTGEICKMLYTLIQADENLKNEQEEQPKIMICGKQLSQSDENKENVEVKEEEKKEDKKYRINVKKKKTSLLVKKSFLQ